MNSKIKFLSWALTALLMCANFISCSDDDDDDDPLSSGDSSNAKPEAVDLGLPSGTLWATFNVGATSSEEYGDYFAWGELEPHYADGHSQDTPCGDWRDGYRGYNWATYKFTNDGGSTFTKYTIDGTTELEDADDVAAQKWGSKWRIPTKEQITELENNCYWIWTNNYNDTNVSGCIVYKAKADADKGKSNRTPAATYDVATDAHIFLPAAGCRFTEALYDVGSGGYYWSRSLGTSYSYDARYLGFYSGGVYSNLDNRSLGRSVRAVQRKN